MVLSIPKAEVIGALVEVALYGPYAVLFCVLVQMSLRQKIANRALSIAALASFFLSTVSLVLDLEQKAGRFVVGADPYRAIYTISAEHSLKAPSPTDLAIHWLDMINGSIADSVLVWRCFVIWERSLIVCALPLLLLLGSTLCALANLIGDSTSFPMSLDLTKAALASTISCNVLTTTLIALKIWREKRVYERVYGRNPSLTNYFGVVLALVIDTGLIYTSSLTGFLISFAAGQDPSYIVIQRAQSQIVGIMPTFIVVYSSLTRARERDSSHFSQGSSSARSENSLTPQSTIFTAKAPAIPPVSVSRRERS